MTSGRRRPICAVVVGVSASDFAADDLLALVEGLDLRKAIHVGHSTGGGEVARYLGRHGTSRAAKAVLIGAVPAADAEDSGQSRRTAH